jgi:alpha-L-arabinofuranosidase
MICKINLSKQWSILGGCCVAFCLSLSAAGLLKAQQTAGMPAVKVKIYPDSVLNDVSNHPLGINLDYFMDNDEYLQPRRKLADALKAMGVKYLRYPGGNKSDFYFFSRPPYNRSIPTLARTGKDAVDGRNRALNSTATDFKNKVLDFDQFMGICRKIGAEPVIVVAADEYLVNYPAGSTWSTKAQLLKNAVEWVRYANIKKKYHVKYWMIANESWNSNNKNSTAEIYARDVVDFSIAMKAVDPGISIIPNGNSDGWWKTVLEKAAGHIDAICLSNYPIYGLPNGFASYRDSTVNLMSPVQTAIAAIEKYASPGDKNRLKVIASEYGPFDWGAKDKWPYVNTMGYNLANFELTGEQLKEPRLIFSCFWNTRWLENDSLKYSVFDALDRDGNFNANGQGLMIWGKFLGKKMVKTTSDVHLRSFASYSPDKKSLFVYLINKSADPIVVDALIVNYKARAVRQAWELSSTGPDDVHPVWLKTESPRDGTRQIVHGSSIKVIEYILH